jgi:hydroxymethylpyrimidine/phosphomethylpyrimidine kinase
MRIALTVAGSDSGGGAGIQADLKTFHRFGVFGTSVVTAVTAQNTRGVFAWTAVAPELVAAQIDAVATDLRPAAVKSGMLADRAIIEAVAGALRRHALAPYVLDPVMVATSGDALSHDGVAPAITNMLLPLAALVTPNLDEAERLTGREVRDVDAMADAARALVAAGAGAALVKGGHLANDDLADVFFDGRDLRVFRAPRIDSTSTHGTGCALSAAITAQLALGHALPAAVESAIGFVRAAIASAPGLGAGHGPLDFFARD